MMHDPTDVGFPAWPAFDFGEIAKILTIDALAVLVLVALIVWLFRASGTAGQPVLAASGMLTSRPPSPRSPATRRARRRVHS
jgi:hypothetical protein